MTTRVGPAGTGRSLAERRGNQGWLFPDLVVEVSGPLGCFTRPELKSERVSYPVMTPSAAVGVLEAIFWKPQFRYVVTAIEVLKQVQWMQLRRNEVKSVISAKEVRDLQADPRKRYDVELDRDQRNTMALRDVAYRIRAQIVTLGDAGAPEEKYREQLRRRVDRGACFSQPFLGCREFTAQFGPATPGLAPIGRNEELGVMLHSIAYTPQGERYRWFRASLRDGVLVVPRSPLPADAVAMPQAPWRADGQER
ncbi:type I-C CRISPR-associated protein Cas5c [Streptacidiphilus fuscans]|uniref:pre-crRNA processing endonuclease n=1 Tax=Streptacidiphilus fuscans TaxID=2789292 RepID=A0A931BCW0_9ACTN|nr:type I-C CRISPR-associated protein Cas5c [Streptacidiphilus fuscans]MBF9071888.1 type I-C CRISPR-associated protein Cas5 [Streptacidiphilus fuscans]